MSLFDDMQEVKSLSDKILGKPNMGKQDNGANNMNILDLIDKPHGLDPETLNLILALACELEKPNA